ncbi:hypothetical protein ACLOJK_025054 [Asimina triloba]
MVIVLMDKDSDDTFDAGDSDFSSPLHCSCFGLESLVTVFTVCISQTFTNARFWSFLFVR